MAFRRFSNLLIGLALACLSLSARAEDMVDKVARAAGVDATLIRAVVMTESRGYPWTLNVDGESVYMPTRDDAVRLIQHVQTAPYLLKVQFRGEKGPRRWFFATREAARDYLAQCAGYRSSSIRRINPLMIDIGLMQINLYYHRDHMPSLEHALDPEWNLRYGTYFLAKLMVKHQNAVTAIGYYNASDPTKRLIYSNKVLQMYRSLTAMRVAAAY